MKKITLLLYLGTIVFSSAHTPNKVTYIELQPYKGISTEYVNVVKRELLKVYPNVTLNQPIELPKQAKVNGRYRADSLLKYLKKVVGHGNIIVGLTNQDITCIEKGRDWGIFGYSYQPSNVCVGSSFRLNKSNKAEQLYKTVVHEIGHTQNLNHCKIKGCLMADAEGKNNIDNENGFCESCSQYLRKKNWKL